MFAWWGRTVYRFRYIVIGVMVALCLGGGVYGISLGEHVTQSGFYDDGSQSVAASIAADKAYGRDRTSHVVAILTPPDGKKVDDPDWMKKTTEELDTLVADHPDQIEAWVGWLKAPTTTLATVQQMKTEDLSKTFVSIPLKGDDDDTILKNYQAVEPDLQQVNGGHIQLAGLNPLASELTGTIGEDQQRAEVAAIPLVCVVLFFVFGGVIAAALPGVIGGLTIAGALGIMRLFAEFMPVHFFAQPVVTLMGLGIAVDYGLFMVSRFREEMAEGYDTEAAVRRAVMTSGRTIMFSAVILVASSVPLLLFPQGFLKSITYAIIASVMLAAILSITVLPAALAILGPRVDALGVRWLLKFAQPDPVAPPSGNPRTNTVGHRVDPRGPAAAAGGHRTRTHRAQAHQADGRAGRSVRADRPGARLLHAAGRARVWRHCPQRCRRHRLRVVLGAARHRDLRRRGRRRRSAGTVRPACSHPDRVVAELARGKDAEEQDARRGRAGFLGQARQRRDEASRRVRRTYRRRHDRAHHPAGTAGTRRHQREVPSPGQRGPSGAGGLRQDLPRVPHRAPDAGHPEHGRRAGDRPAGRRDPEQGHDDHRVHRARRRPVEDVASHAAANRATLRSASSRTALSTATTPRRRSTNYGRSHRRAGPPYPSAAHRLWNRTAFTVCSTSCR